MNKNVKFRKLNSGERTSSSNVNINDVMNFLDEYFEDLEMDNLKDNNEVHSELMKNIINKYKKIFKLWNKDKIFSIDENVFKNIYNSMRYTFGDIDDHRSKLVSDYRNELLFNLECKLCGEKFPLRNKDCVYSFKYHTITSATHKDFLNKLNIDYGSTGELDEVEDINNKQTETGDPDIEVCSHFVHTRCYLCSENIMSHDVLESKNCGELNNRILTHLQSITHSNNSKLFQDNGKYFEEVCFNKNVLKCKMCFENLFIDEMVQHFNSEPHKNRVAGVEAGGINGILENMCI